MTRGGSWYARRASTTARLIGPGHPEHPRMIDHGGAASLRLTPGRRA
jgi:hypothetical protein